MKYIDKLDLEFCKILIDNLKELEYKDKFILRNNNILFVINVYFPDIDWVRLNIEIYPDMFLKTYMSICFNKKIKSEELLKHIKKAIGKEIKVLNNIIDSLNIMKDS